MSSTLKELRAAAEPYKSFPKAIAAVVQAMFDKGATQVTIRFNQHTVNMDSFYPTVFCDVEWFNLSDVVFFRAFHVYKPAWALAHTHHAKDFRANDQSYAFVNLGMGEGVNPKQNRSAKRLIRELPRLLSPSETYNTIVIDETGTEHRLVKNVPSKVIDGLRVSWPEKLIGFGREGLILKFGAVRVPIGKFLERCQLEPEERKRLDILTHSWLQGIVEIAVTESRLVDIPVPPESADDFFDFFYRRGHAEQLARAILQIVPAVAMREMYKMVMVDLGDFSRNNGQLKLNNDSYVVMYADEVNLWRVEHVVLGGYSHPGESRHELLFNLTHPVFRTIGPGREEIMQVLWWQLAIWIAQNQPEVFAELAHFNLRVNAIYLALREQNPERSWDEE